MKSKINWKKKYDGKVLQHKSLRGLGEKRVKLYDGKTSSLISCLNVRAYFSSQNIESKSVLQSCQLFSPTDHKTDKICIAACHKCTCIRWPIYIDNLLDCAIQAQERIWSKIFQKCSKNMNISRYLIFLVFPKDKKLKCIQYILLKKLT